MDMNIFWQQLGLRDNLTANKVQLALAIFACEYVTVKEEITEFKHFKEL
jgi:hypothetical protein